MSRMSSESWKADADPLAVRRQRLLDLERRTGEPGAVAGGGRDQRAGLAGDHPQVVLERVLALRRAERSPGSGPRPAGRRSRPGSGPRRHRARAVSSEDFANRKSPVRIATRLSQRALADSRAAAQRGLVHHVVVVERGEVGQLDHAGRGDDAVGAAGSPVSAASSTSSGRNRLPPACIRCRAASVTKRRLALDRRRSSSASTSAMPRHAAAPRASASRIGSASEAGAVRSPRSCSLVDVGGRSADELSGVGGEVEHRTRDDAQGDRGREADRDHDGRQDARASTTVGPSPTGSEKYISTITRT